MARGTFPAGGLQSTVQYPARPRRNRPSGNLGAHDAGLAQRGNGARQIPWPHARSRLGRRQGRHGAPASRLRGHYHDTDLHRPRLPSSGALFSAGMHGFTRADTEAAWRPGAGYRHTCRSTRPIDARSSTTLSSIRWFATSVRIAPGSTRPCRVWPTPNCSNCAPGRPGGSRLARRDRLDRQHGRRATPQGTLAILAGPRPCTTR